jgi:gelsolin
MQKQTKYNIADTNIANLGSDLEKKVREAAAKNEPAWTNAGKTLGLQIWRIEKFNVKSWPTHSYGSFYTGDSYIVLNTYKKEEKYLYDVHFWLGNETTQDEAGTAAYKTVELDDFLGGAPVQHREVQGNESALFLSYFKAPITILEGGIESGFRHVKPEEYKPRLLHLKGKKRVRVTQVPLTRDSLNSGDVFILDGGANIFQWNGSGAGAMEKAKAMQVSEGLESDRKGKARVTVLSEGEDDKQFWELLGGKGPVKSASEGGDDNEAPHGERKLFKLSDASGTLNFEEVAKGDAVKRTLLQSDDVFVLDNGSEVFAWVGKGSSAGEKRGALNFAAEYVVKQNLPPFTTISRVLEGGENSTFKNSFAK